MKWVNHVQTLDGKLHLHAFDGKKHAEKVYGEALTKVAHQLVRVEKYQAMCDFVDSHIEEFVMLKLLKDDLILETSDED